MRLDLLEPEPYCGVPGGPAPRLCGEAGNPCQPAPWTPSSSTSSGERCFLRTEVPQSGNVGADHTVAFWTIHTHARRWAFQMARPSRTTSAWDTGGLGKLIGLCWPASPEGRSGELRGGCVKHNLKFGNRESAASLLDSNTLFLRIYLLKTGGTNSVEQFKRDLVEIELMPSPPTPRGPWQSGTWHSFLLSLHIEGVDWVLYSLTGETQPSNRRLVPGKASVTRGCHLGLKVPLAWD